MNTSRRIGKFISLFLALAIFAGVFFIVRANEAHRKLLNNNLLHRISFESKNIVNTAYAEDNNPGTGITKGTFTEKIEDIEYQKEVHYGASGLFSLDEMTKDLSVEIYLEDKVKVFPDPKLGIGSKIEILRANPVIIVDVREIKNYRTWKRTTKEFLEEQGINLGEKDKVKPDLDSLISRDLEIKITRVAYTQLIEKESINYKTIYDDDPSLEKGLTKTKQSGRSGIKELTYQVIRENGEEVSRKLIKTEVTREPQNKIIIRGTKVVAYGSGTATWYDWVGGMTAAHNSLPYGTMVRVVNEANGKEVVVKIVDHGIRGGAIIDLSDQAFSQLAPLSKGRIKVRLEKP